MDKLSLLKIAASKRIGYWAAVVIYAAIIFTLSSMSHPLPNLAFIEVSGGDKILHGIEYAGLSFLVYKALKATFGRLRVPRMVLIVFVAAGLYAVSDEFHQSFVPGRDACAADAVADHVGILVGVGVSLL